MNYFEEILKGFHIFFQPMMVLKAMMGFFIGTFFGATPGLTATLAIALLLPFTYRLDVTSSLIVCTAIFMSGIYSGSITAITINIPGAPSAMMTAIEGYPLMKKGLGAKALGHAAFSSMVGGTVGSILLILFLPFTSKFILIIKTPGKFSLILFALIVIIIVQKESIIKGAIVTLLGVLTATIGIDVDLPVARFTFGITNLTAGIDFIPVIIGTFAISELLLQSESGTKDDNIIREQVVKAKIKRKYFIPKLSEIKGIGWINYLKSIVIGFFIGVLPGAGGSMAAFVSYSEGMRSSKHREEYGKGSLEGIACAEAANNAMCGGALVPMLTFGIPGDGASAVMLGVLLINGLKPGLKLIGNQLPLIAPMFASLLISALIFIPLTLYILGPYLIKIVSIRKSILYSSIAAISMVGAYVATNSTFQLILTIILGGIIYLLRKQEFPSVPFLLGVLLGPLLEMYFRRSMQISKCNPMIFLTSLDSLFFLVLAGIFYYFLIIRKRA